MSRIPRPLSELYEDLYIKALESTEETDRALFRNTLKWMLCTTRVFGWEDFSLAITAFVDIEVYEIDEDFILDLLSNFVISQKAQDGNRTFSFAHLSVREFLETKPEYCMESSNTFAAEVCLLKLLGASGSPSAEHFLSGLGLSDKDTVTLSEIDSYRKGIHDYSLRNWNVHCVGAGETNRSDEELHIFHLLRYFLFDDSDSDCPLKCWVHSRQRRKMEGVCGVHLLQLLQNYHRSRDRGVLLSCVFGFSEVLRTNHYHDLDDDVKEACILAAVTHSQYYIWEYLMGETKGRLPQKRILNALVENDHIEPLRLFLTLIEPDLITVPVILDTGCKDKEIIELLLDHNKNLHITTELIEESITSYTAIEAILSRAPDILITSEILRNTIVDIPIERLREILDKNGGSIITCEVIAVATYYGSRDGMRAKTELLLERAGKVKGTERAMMQAVSSQDNSEVLGILLNHGWPVTESVMAKAARWGKVAPFEVMLKAGGPITPKVIVGGARNIRDGARMVKLLVSLMNRSLDDELWVQMMLQCARNTWGNPETLQVLLEMKPGLKVAEEILIACTENSIKGNIILDVILEDNREMQVTDAVIVHALKQLDYDETISKLLDRHGSTHISSQMLLGAAQNRRFADEMTKLLLQRTATIEKPSSVVVDAVIRNQFSGYKTLQMLESRFGQLDLCETSVQTAAESGNHAMLTFVLDRCSTTKATPPVLLAAAAKGSLEVMKHLLKLNNAVVTQDILIGASGNSGCSLDMLRVLWKFAPHIEVCPQMFLNAAYATDVEFLFSRVKDAQLCQDILNAVMTKKETPNDWRDWVSVSTLNLILESEFEVSVTDGLIVGALKAGRGWVLKTLFAHRQDIAVSQDMVDTAIERAVEQDDYRPLQVLVKYGDSCGLDLHDARVILANFLWGFSEE